MLFEALENIVYSLFGLAVGFAVGRATREVHEVREEVHEVKETVVHEENGSPSPPPPPAHRKPPEKKQGTFMQVFKSRTLGVLLVILAILTVVLSTLSINEDRQQTECFREYNSEFVRAFIERAKAGDKDRAALNKMLLSLNNPDPVARRAVFQNYLRQIQATDAQRAKVPLPSPPDPAQFCQRK